jgi:thioredoxin-related protein
LGLLAGCAKNVAPGGEKVEVEWLTDFSAAKREAAEKQRPILIDFSGSDWCGWCIKLENEVFSQPAFVNYATNNLVLFLADFPRSKPQPDEIVAQNRQLSEAYGVQGFPTVLLVDEKGKELARTGYLRGGAEAYVKHLQSLLPAPQK